MNMWGCCHHQQQQQQKALVGFGVCVSEMRIADNPSSDGVVCPKPRRLVNLVHYDPLSFRPSRFLPNINQQLEACESKAGIELLDIMKKGDCGAEKANFQVASSPPFFSGSPPVRASNPLIQDERFGNGKPSPLSPATELLMNSSPSSCKSSSGGGCVRVKYGYSQAPVRIEGFNCRVSAVA